MKQLTLNLQNDMEPTGEMRTSSLPVGFRSCANPFHLQVNDLERQITETSGRSIIEQSGRYNRLGSLGKMFLGCLIGQTGWYSSRCRLTWKMKGTRSGRLYFQLAASTRPTEEKGFGLLPAPTASEIDNSGRSIGVTGSNRRIAKDGRTWGNNIATMAGMGLLPTPTCQDVNSRTNRSLSLNAAIRPNIALMAKKGLLPTPQAIDGSGQGRKFTDEEGLHPKPGKPGQLERRSEGFCVAGDTSDANSERKQERHNARITKQQGWFNRAISSPQSWQNFPTQPPVCSGDDGFSTGLDKITFPKWRNESIKAAGNAIVPQVAFQIFKAITEFTNRAESIK